MPSSRPLRADARRNREALLTAAREAFLTGDADAHVEEIARRAGVAVGTLYRHFETREALVAEVYRQEVAELCAAPARLLADHAPDEALRRFLLLLVAHSAVGKGMAEALESIMATDSPIFDDARAEMARALDELLAAGVAAGAIRPGVSGRVLLRALGGICGMRAKGWEDDAVRITAILYDGLRLGAASRG
ncbi:TetR/AcrR family transcriptional regulator [Streptomyces rugosispiralis]|uniref:TetR/AcrR family transcriptional regulator n=1 Tax=Streptomyces rugosispiralis TaxID=2967341 RepID=A0ABT1UT31_9ACTN|nr:TetR/AcrR family transcriptional regulator [Streptomyces rugosispiralis]MCQ8188267.1 TetR/AcrR family transcriptional regulator [Streptomyces rugosispiralis]